MVLSHLNKEKLNLILFKLSRLPRSVYLLEILGGLLFFSFAKVLQHTNFINLRFLLFLVGFQVAYFSVYIINDIIDLPNDKKNEKYKKIKPLVSGEVSTTIAYKLAFTYILTGIILAFISEKFIGLNIVLFALLYNLFYTVILKKTYFTKILGNSFIHVFRVIIPVLLQKNCWVIFNINIFGVLLLYWLLGAMFSHIKHMIIYPKYNRYTPLIRGLFISVAVLIGELQFYTHDYFLLFITCLLMIIGVLFSYANLWKKIVNFIKI